MTIDSERLDKEICQEVLDEAKDVLQALLDTSNYLSSKLATVLTQSATLAVAAFSGAALSFAPAPGAAPLIAAWTGSGFLAAGLGWLCAAVIANQASRPRDWSIGFSPDKLWIPDILNPPSTAYGYLFIAKEMQHAIAANMVLNTEVAHQLKLAQWFFVWAVVFGLIAAGGAFDFQTLSIIHGLKFGKAAILFVTLSSFAIIVLLSYFTFSNKADRI